jgi:hypothetical protein
LRPGAQGDQGAAEEKCSLHDRILVFAFGIESCHASILGREDGTRPNQWGARGRIGLRRQGPTECYSEYASDLRERIIERFYKDHHNC